MRACPNKQSAEWKKLESSLGETDAYKVFLHNGSQVPTMPEVNKYISAFTNRLDASDFSSVTRQLKKIPGVRQHNGKLTITKHGFATATKGIAEINSQLGYPAVTKHMIERGASEKWILRINAKPEIKEVQDDDLITKAAGNQYFYKGELYPTFDDAYVARDRERMGIYKRLNTPSEIDGVIEDLMSTGEVQFVNEETGKPCMKVGGKTGFTTGGDWEVIKDFKGSSHEQGGIDIAIGDGTISMSGKQGSIKAENGVVVPGDTVTDGEKKDNTKYIADPKEFKIREQAYNDSLALHQHSMDVRNKVKNTDFEEFKTEELLPYYPAKQDGVRSLGHTLQSSTRDEEGRKAREIYNRTNIQPTGYEKQNFQYDNDEGYKQISLEKDVEPSFPISEPNGPYYEYGFSDDYEPKVGLSDIEATYSTFKKPTQPVKKATMAVPKMEVEERPMTTYRVGEKVWKKDEFIARYGQKVWDNAEKEWRRNK